MDKQEQEIRTLSEEEWESFGPVIQAFREGTVLGRKRQPGRGKGRFLAEGLAHHLIVCQEENAELVKALEEIATMGDSRDQDAHSETARTALAKAKEQSDEAQS